MAHVAAAELSRRGCDARDRFWSSSGCRIAWTCTTAAFGGRNVSGIIGILYTSVAFGTLIGPSAAGFAFDLGHSYTLPILASAGANIVAAAIVAVTSGGSQRNRIAAG
jgi:hypothetical protein